MYERIRDSIVVSIPACHAGDPGSIPGRGAFFFFGTFNHLIKYLFNNFNITMDKSKQLTDD